MLRIAEREGTDASEITMGRIQTLEEFVYYLDRVTGLQIIQQVFNTFPSTPGSDAPDALLSILVLIVWIWWKFETAAMVYQFNMYGLFPRVRSMCTTLKTASLAWIDRKRAIPL